MLIVRGLDNIRETKLHIKVKKLGNLCVLQGCLITCRGRALQRASCAISGPWEHQRLCIRARHSLALFSCPRTCSVK